MATQADRFPVPERFRMSDEMFGWEQTARYYGRTPEEQAAARDGLDRKSFLRFLQEELEENPELQSRLYGLIQSLPLAVSSSDVGNPEGNK